MGNKRAGSSGPGDRLLASSLPILALLFPTGAARPTMRLVSRDSLPAIGRGTAMDLDVTSLSHRRAVRRWERVSVGDVLERLTWSPGQGGRLAPRVGCPRGDRPTPRRSRARPAALVLHEMQGHPERRLPRREDRADLVGLEFALQDDPSACQFRFGVFDVG